MKMCFTFYIFLNIYEKICAYALLGRHTSPTAKSFLNRKLLLIPKHINNRQGQPLYHSLKSIQQMPLILGY